MKKVLTIFLGIFFLVVFFSTGSFSSVQPEDPNKASKVKTIESYGKLPLSFIENRGQIDGKVSYCLKGRKGTIYFTKDGVIYDLLSINARTSEGAKKTSLLRHRKPKDLQRLSFTLSPIGANRDVELIAKDRFSGKVNYIIGNDPKKWHTDIPMFKKIIYKNLYNGIDLKIYGTNRQMEYDFIVSPGADPRNIKIACKGIDSLRLDRQGDLIINTPLGDIKHLKPLIYQEVYGRRHIVEGSYVVAKNTFSFKVGDYDKKHPLVIDPLTLSYSTYLGGSNHDYGEGIAVDASLVVHM